MKVTDTAVTLFACFTYPPIRPTSCLQQLPCGHEYCKSCVEELRQKGVDKSCPLCRKPLPPGPDQLYDLGYGMYMKIKGAIDRSRPGVDVKEPWPALTDEQQSEMDHAVAMLREAADQFIYSKGNKQGIASKGQPPVKKLRRNAAEHSALMRL